MSALQSPDARVQVNAMEDAGGARGLAHWVRPSDNGHTEDNDPTTAQDIVDAARAAGHLVIAACGTAFVPRRDPHGLDVCSPCCDIAATELGSAS